MQKAHVDSIFKEYVTPSRVLRSFTNLSNAVIQTALSGQNKFIFEILQNADDSFENELESIEVHFIVKGSYLIVHHNGKGFDCKDVERICDYASQIEEVKATDLSKTGYKGLGFKSLFNLSDCIYICSNGYSFRFDKRYWSDSSSRPWQVIPIWCSYDELPLKESYPYDQPVNFALKIMDLNKLKCHLEELVDRPEVLLYMNRVYKVEVNFKGKTHSLEKIVENLGEFSKVNIYNNQSVVSTWILRTYKRNVTQKIRKYVQSASEFIFPDKIKTAKEIKFTFALQSNESVEEISTIKGLFHNTLPTQLHLFPYHINSYFILSLDRTQLHENEWNKFLICQIGNLQFSLLKDLAEMPRLKNYVIMFFCRKIDSLCSAFTYALKCRRYAEGFNEAKSKIGWIPRYEGSPLLKIGEAWIDETKFFKQDFQNVRWQNIQKNIIDYAVKGQNRLLNFEAKRFTYEMLFRDFAHKIYPQLTTHSYISFINYLYESSKENTSDNKIINQLKDLTFLVGKDKTLLTPKSAFLEEKETPIPDVLMLNAIDDVYLPTENIDLIKNWLASLGARRLMKPADVLRESVLKWLDTSSLCHKMNSKNHIEIINYLAENFEQLTREETEKLRENFLVLTKSGEFSLSKLCYFPEAVPISVLAEALSDNEKISSCYHMESLKGFFKIVGVKAKLKPINVMRRTVLKWIENDQIDQKLTKSNYLPIIEYISSHYFSLENNLNLSEKLYFKHIPVLTINNELKTPKVCYFDYALPNVKGLENVIEKNKLVSTKNISIYVHKFIKELGVSESISPILVLRESVLKWIQYDIKRITPNNIHGILSYIAEHWDTLNGVSGLQTNEKVSFKKIPILTKSGALTPAYKCYWPTSNFSSCAIPGLESIISDREFVSPKHCSVKMRTLLEELGVHNVQHLKFIDIYEKYSNNLNCPENMKWFFDELINYWERNKLSPNKDVLLKYLQRKFQSNSCLLSRNPELCYPSTKLYSSRFYNVYTIDPMAIYLLDYDNVPQDLEKWLGFKEELELTCIVRLLKALEKAPELGEEKTVEFFRTILEQLRRKHENEIKLHEIFLLSENNKLTSAKKLNYFVEEDATCYLKECYLKRIIGMSHEDTLELANLCGVSVWPYNQEVTFGGEPAYDNTLKEFYLERLPFIVIQESKKLNESRKNCLKRLHSKICCIKFFECAEISIKYPFGSPHKTRYHFMGLNIYMTSKWNGCYKSKIHDHLCKEIGLKTTITVIMDMKLPEDKDNWLSDEHISGEELESIYKELKELFKVASSLDPLTAEESGHSKSEDCEEKVPKIEEAISVEPSPNENISGIEIDTRSQVRPKTIIPKGRSSGIEVTPSEIAGGNHLSTGNSNNRYFIPIVEDCVGKSFLKWVGERYVSVFLRYCKYKYSNSYFILPECTRWKSSPMMEIWLKETEDKNHFEGCIKIIIKWLVPSEHEIDCSFTEECVLATNSLNSDDDSNQERFLNWLGDKYVPRFLHTYVRNRYPNSGFRRGIFWKPPLKPEIRVTKDENQGENVIDVNLNIIWFVDRKLDDDKSESDKVENQGPRQTNIFDNPPSSKRRRSTTSDGDCVHSESLHIKRLAEMHVFDFLQDHYRNKYPNSQCNVSGGIFKLKGQNSRNIEVIWLNENDEKGKAYDLLLKKDDAIKQIIEVETTCVTKNDSFNLSHGAFINKIHCLTKELPRLEGKYCLYSFIIENSLISTCKVHLNKPVALYKTVQLRTF